MKLIADLHIHSKYSLATSKQLELGPISKACKRKGIGLCSTGDITHPLWVNHLQSNLKPAGEGLFSYGDVLFILGGEVSQVYRQDGKCRRIHNLLFVPGFKELEKLNEALSPYGKLASDGRPVLKLDCPTLVRMAKDISPRIEIIPAHAWTPWYSVFGSKSGFDSLEECFGEMAGEIKALETGLSSDPAMNWQWSALDNISLISNSDAHSPDNLGREANLFDIEPGFDSLFEAIYSRNPGKFLSTLEFFPEEGKYHLDGHRKCQQALYPRESNKLKDICPVCGKPLTLGVLNRIESLADRPEGYQLPDAVPFVRLVPLIEIIAQVLQVKTSSKKAKTIYDGMLQTLGTEFDILLNLPLEEITHQYQEIGEAIGKVRKGDLVIHPGYDGVYGEVKLA